MLACCLPLILTLQDGRAVRQALAFVIRCYFFSFATLYYSGLRGGNLCVSWIVFDAKISDYHELSNSTDSEPWEGHILPLIMWTIERGMVKQSGSKQSNFFWTHVFLVCILRFAPNQPPLKYWCPIKISNRNRFPCLRPLRLSTNDAIFFCSVDVAFDEWSCTNYFVLLNPSFVPLFLMSSLFLESLILEKFLVPAAIIQKYFSLYLTIVSIFLASESKATLKH